MIAIILDLIAEKNRVWKRILLQGRSLTVHDKISTLRFAEVVFDRETLQKQP